MMYLMNVGVGGQSRVGTCLTLLCLLLARIPEIGVFDVTSCKTLVTSRVG